MTAIPKWNTRLDAMDHTKGTTDKMRKAAMRAEIADLRRVVAAHARVLGKVRASRDEWRADAMRYQKRLAAKRI